MGEPDTFEAAGDPGDVGIRSDGLGEFTARDDSGTDDELDERDEREPDDEPGVREGFDGRDELEGDGSRADTESAVCERLDVGCSVESRSVEKVVHSGREDSVERRTSRVDEVDGLDVSELFDVLEVFDVFETIEGRMARSDPDGTDERLSEEAGLRRAVCSDEDERRAGGPSRSDDLPGGSARGRARGGRGVAGRTAGCRVGAR